MEQLNFKFEATSLPGNTGKFIPSIGNDIMVKGGLSFPVATKLHCITSMNEYQNTSFEELRDKHFAADHKDEAFPPSNTTAIGRIGKLLQDFKGLLASGENSDVTFQVKDKEFRAHKAILAARCSVFSAMFKHNMEEKVNGVVNIEDVDPETFGHLLQYLYSSSINNVSLDDILYLYIASDKYQVEELKTDCLYYLMRNITVDNFCEILSLSLRYDEKELTEMVKQFFVKNCKEIILTVKWQSFLSKNSVTGNELFLEFVQSVSEKEQENQCSKCKCIGI